MSASALALGLVGASLFLCSGAVVSVTVRRAYFADWRGSAAAVVLAVTALSWTLAIGQVLGAFGWLQAAPLVGVAMASAALAVLIRQRGPAQEAVPAPTGDDATSAKQSALFVTTVILVLFVAAVWTARTALTVRRGIYDPDSLGYHLPFAATFAQTGHADPTRFPYPDSPVQFFPANDELIVAIALLLTKSFVFAAVKNLLYGGLVLVAAHAIGKAFNAAWLAVSGVAIVLALPAVAFAQAGEAMNDTLPLFALMAGVALLAHARDRHAPYVLAGACTGVAYGSKYSTVIPAIALAALALLVLLKRIPTKRLRAAGLGALASITVGASWYLRNAITYGSPLPPARIGLGPFHLRRIVANGASESFSVAHYLIRGDAYRQFWHGLILGLSPLFLPVVAALIIGSIAGLRSKGFPRGLSVIALVAGIGYVTLPGSAYGSEGKPGGGFVINLHYAMPALTLGAVAAAVAIGQRRWVWIVPVTGWLVVATSIGPGQRVRFWSPEIGGRSFGFLIFAALAGGGVAWMSTRPQLTRWVRPAAGAVAVMALFGVIVVVRQYPRRSEVDAVQRWAATVPPTTIGGWVPAGLLYGPGASNRVVTLTRDRSINGGPVAIDACPVWMQALKDGRFPYAAVMSNTRWQRWLDADPAFQLVVQNEPPALYRVAVYRVVGQAGHHCPGLG